MKKYPVQARSRRQLCAGVLRYATLGLFAAGGAALFIKRQRLLREGVCINEGICNRCQILARCGLPQALTAKKTLAGGTHDGK